MGVPIVDNPAWNTKKQFVTGTGRENFCDNAPKTRVGESTDDFAGILSFG